MLKSGPLLKAVQAPRQLPEGNATIALQVEGLARPTRRSTIEAATQHSLEDGFRHVRCRVEAQAGKGPLRSAALADSDPAAGAWNSAASRPPSFFLSHCLKASRRSTSQRIQQMQAAPRRPACLLVEDRISDPRGRATDSHFRRVLKNILTHQGLV